MRKTPQEVMAWLLDRMKRRAEGRERMKAAERRRRIKAEKHKDESFQVLREYKGLVDDAEYGEKPPRMSLLEARKKMGGGS